MPARLQVRARARLARRRESCTPWQYTRRTSCAGFLFAKTYAVNLELSVVHDAGMTVQHARDARTPQRPGTQRRRQLHGQVLRYGTAGRRPNVCAANSALVSRFHGTRKPQHANLAPQLTHAPGRFGRRILQTERILAVGVPTATTVTVASSLSAALLFHWPVPPGLSAQLDVQTKSFLAGKACAPARCHWRPPSPPPA